MSSKASPFLWPICEYESCDEDAKGSDTARYAYHGAQDAIACDLRDPIAVMTEPKGSQDKDQCPGRVDSEGQDLKAEES